MMGTLLPLLHNMVMGGIAAAGFGVLFNIGARSLYRCVAAGALALGVRTLGLNAGMTLEAASFLAAIATGTVAQVLSIRGEIARSSLAVAGCIPMIPGGFAAKTIVSLFTLTAPTPEIQAQVTIETVQYVFRAILTFGALGAGMAIPFQIFGDRGR